MLALKRPFIGFIIGILLASIWPDLVLLLSSLLLLAAFFVSRSGAAFLFALLFGAVWVNFHWVQVNAHARSLDAGKTQQVVMGDVGFVSRQSHKLEFDFYPVDETTKLKVSCYRCPFDVAGGERWQFNLKIKPIHSFQNPGGFDYRKWMLAKGYSAQAYVYAKSESNQLIDKASLGFLNQLSLMLTPNSFPILRALILGDKNGLKGSDKRLVFSSGISHLFVVSGLHVGIVAGMVGLLLYWLQRPLLLLGWPHSRSIAVLSGLGVASLYGLVTGFQVPAIRAVLMLSCAVLMMYQTRFTHVIHYFLFALVIVMLAKPLAFMDMGSWLSFSIVLALIVGFAGSSQITWVKGLLKAQWLAFCMGGMVLLGFNQALVPLSLCVNLLLIPIFTLFVMPAILLAVVCALLGDVSGLVWLETILEGLLVLLHRFDGVINWWLPVFEGYRYLLMFGLALCLLPSVLRLRILGVLTILVVLLLPVNRPEYGGFNLTVFDVGQGSAALIETKDKNILVDTGARFMNGLGLADFVILPYLRQQRITKLDMLHITHDDNDHAGGLGVLAEKSNIIIEQGQCSHATWQYDGVSFVRFQAKGFKEGNNGSCLLKVTSAVGQSVLFTGDIEKEAEFELVAQKKVDLSANILIVPHHGSRSSSSNEFLNVINGQVAIVSAGFLNHYGHPHAQILAKYDDRNMMVYTTAYDGAIQVAFPPRQEALVVSTYRPDFGFTE
jgi:competence protein ComEC